MATTTTKIFIGCPLTSEVRMHLEQSSSWKSRSLGSDVRLEEVRFDGRDYLGAMVDGSLSKGEIEGHEQQFRHQLSLFCPRLECGSIPLVLIPQVFVS